MKKKIMAGALGLCVLTSGTAMAAGFALIEQSVSGLGTAFSGAAAVEDASTVYFNPAGMTLLKGQQFVGGLHYIMPSAKFTKVSAKNAAGADISGGNSGEAGLSKAVPNLYYVKNFDKMSIGLGINAPFGMATEYDKDWVGRYHAVNSDVKTVNINPSVAFQVTDKLSLGAGVSAQKIDVNLSSMIDFGLSAYVASGYNAGYASLPSNSRADVYADMTADGWGYGYNFGILYAPVESTRLGLAYRSEIKHSVKGDSNFTTNDPAFLALFPHPTAVNLSNAAAASFVDQGIKGDITLPATASVNIYQELNPAWAVMADVTWTQWSKFDKLVIKFDQGIGAGGATKETVTTEKWKNNMRYSLGTTYKASDALKLRAGVAYDQTPVDNDIYRTPRIPDNSRTWISGGAGYAVTENVVLNFGYAHLFVKEGKSAKSAVGEDLSRGSLTGTYNTSVDIASAELVVKF